MPLLCKIEKKLTVKMRFFQLSYTELAVLIMDIPIRATGKAGMI